MKNEVADYAKSIGIYDSVVLVEDLVKKKFTSRRVDIELQPEYDVTR